ncbi:protein MIZU-KUSSEI 1 [Rhododendron vialii]|uniref:protein MIZU-KUSSEI 1 n=1 Tax=Rhododendron vialii TaxID=182163 RepID=UPI00265E907E|nr:protein MIZU-KUSSEI 1 [Rhododendron vialii]
MQQEQLHTLPRTTSSSRSTKRIIPSNYLSSLSSFNPDPPHETSKSSLIRKRTQTRPALSTILKSLLNLFSIPSLNIPAACRLLSLPATTPPLGRKVTGTLFGHRRGHVTFAVQIDPRSEPVLLIELAISTSNLVKEMSSGLVRIALESERERSLEPRGGRHARRLYSEPTWTMYCNGRKVGYASTRACGESDWHVLSTVRSVSVGAGVIPVVDSGRKEEGLGLGELLYMRARFERVVGSRDSEAFYMMNPDGNGGPELSVFLLRL